MPGDAAEIFEYFTAVLGVQVARGRCELCSYVHHLAETAEEVQVYVAGQLRRVDSHVGVLAC